MKSLNFKRKSQPRNGGKQTVYQLVDVDERPLDNDSDPRPNIENNEGMDQGGKSASRPAILPGPSILRNTMNTKTSNYNQESPQTQEEDTMSEGSVTSQDEYYEFEMVDQINDALTDVVDETKAIGGSNITVIQGHEWKFGSLFLRVKWDTGQETLEKVNGMKIDHPIMTAQYLIENQVARSKRQGNRDLQWAKKTLRDIQRAIK